MALFDDSNNDLSEALRGAGENDYVDGCMRRIGAMKGVKGTILLNSECLPLRCSFEDTDQQTIFKYMSAVNQLVLGVTTALRSLDKIEPEAWGTMEQGLKCLRVRSKKVCLFW